MHHNMNWNRFRGITLGIFCFLAWGAMLYGTAPSGKTLEGARVELFADPTKDVVVILFVAVECPISNRFAPVVNRIHEDFEANDFAMWTVYTDDLFTTDQIEKHRTDYQYKIPVLIDFDRKLAKYCGASVTPEAVVYVRESSEQYRMVYRGRVNNQYVDFGKWRQKSTKQDLLEVLTEVRENGIDGIEFQETRAIGCYIGD